MWIGPFEDTENAEDSVMDTNTVRMAMDAAEIFIVDCNVAKRAV
jgi:hypothetical protein